MKLGGILSTFKTTFTGLTSQVKRLEVIAENIANAEKVADASGRVYRRKVLVDPTVEKSRSGGFGEQMRLKLRKSRAGHLSSSEISGAKTSRSRFPESPVKVVSVEGERLVYDPNHPQADDQGYVKVPNVNVVEEMVDMITASRTYEANITVLEAAKQMAKRALEI
jgi:flagellar basal-body rod protein FlgC